MEEKAVLAAAHSKIDKVLSALKYRFESGTESDVNGEIAELRARGITFNRTYSDGKYQWWDVIEAGRTIQSIEFRRR